MRTACIFVPFLRRGVEVGLVTPTKISTARILPAMGERELSGGLEKTCIFVACLNIAKSGCQASSHPSKA